MLRIVCRILFVTLFCGLFGSGFVTADELDIHTKNLPADEKPLCILQDNHGRITLLLELEANTQYADWPLSEVWRDRGDFFLNVYTVEYYPERPGDRYYFYQTVHYVPGDDGNYMIEQFLIGAGIVRDNQEFGHKSSAPFWNGVTPEFPEEYQAYMVLLQYYINGKTD